MDPVMEQDPGRWSVGPTDDQKGYLEIALQEEIMHETDRGLLLTFRNLIAPTKDGDTFDDRFQNAVRSDLGHAFGQMDRYTRLTAWVRMEGMRHAEVSLLLSFADPANPSRSVYLASRTPLSSGTWTKLILSFDHLPEETRRRPRSVGIMRSYYRKEPGDEETMRLYLDDWRLERARERKCRGTDPDPSVVIVNQAGYQPADRKLGVVAGTHPSDRFRLRASADGSVALEGTLDPRAFHLGAMKLADFTGFRRPGRYFVEAGGIRSVDFDIRDGLYGDLAKTLASGLRQMRCGAAVEAHDACHLDNAKRLDTGAHVDLVGGYHDAGDTRKYNWNDPVALYHCALAAQAARAAGRSDGPHLDEARWAAAHIEKLVREFGSERIPARIENREGRRRHCNYWTDNVPGNEDDHVINADPEGFAGLPPHVCLDMALGFASLAELEGAGSAEGKRWLSLAEEVWQANEKAAEKDQFTAAMAGMAAIRLHRLTGRESYALRARDLGRVLLRLQELRFVRGPHGPVAGYFYNSAANDLRQVWRMMYHDPAVRMLAELGQSFPDDPEAPDWRAALRLYAEFFVRPMMRLEQPYGWVFSGLVNDVEHEEDLVWCAANARLYGRYLPLGTRPAGAALYLRLTGLHRNGHDNSIAGLTRLYLAQALSDPDLQEAARRCLGFLLGENAFNGMSITGLGQDPLVPAHNIIGPVPGLAIASGVGHDFFTRFNEDSGDKEVSGLATACAMSLAARLAEPFHLSGKVTARDPSAPAGLTLTALDGDGRPAEVTLDADGCFGPLALAPGLEYEIRAGPITRRIVAVAGGRKTLAMDLRGEVRLSRGTARHAGADTPAPGVPPGPAAECPPDLLQPHAGEDVALEVLLTPQGTPPAAGRLLMRGYNVILPRTEREYRLDGNLPVRLPWTFRPDKPGEVFTVQAWLPDQPDAVVEWVGLALPTPAAE